MYFSMKSYLKNNRKNTAEQTVVTLCLVIAFVKDYQN